MPAPALDEEALRDALARAVDDALGVDLGPVIDLYRDLVATGDPDCPELEVEALVGGTRTTTRWATSCVAANGTELDAQAALTVLDGYVDPDTGQAQRGVELIFEGSIVAKDGRALAGEAVLREHVGALNGEVERVRHIHGAIGGDAGDEAESPLLDGTMDAQLQVAAKLNADAERRSITIDGSTTIHADEARSTRFGGLTLESAAEDETCAWRPKGTIGIRDTGGEWYDVAFEDGGACGCGQTSFRGRAIGASCLDPSSLLASEAP